MGVVCVTPPSSGGGGGGGGGLHPLKKGLGTDLVMLLKQYHCTARGLMCFTSYGKIFSDCYNLVRIKALNKISKFKLLSLVLYLLLQKQNGLLPESRKRLLIAQSYSRLFSQLVLLLAKRRRRLELEF